MLSTEQSKIIRSMLLAILTALLAATVTMIFSVNWHLGRVESYLLALILPTCSYVIGIGRIASLRFFDESVSNPLLAVDNIKLNTLKQYLSNTHEQLFLAAIAYALLSCSLPIEHIYLVFSLSACFAIGRLLFANGYSRGASERSLGFALTFYSNLVGFGIGSIFLIKSII